MAAKLSKKPTDRRIDKTRSALGEALARLMESTDWNDISIQRLCAEANVARSSFYLHYDSTAHLLDDMIKRKLDQVIAMRNEGCTLLEWLVDHVTTHKTLFHRTVKAPQGAIVFSRFKSAVSIYVAEDYRQRGQTMTVVQLAFLVGGVFETLQVWARTWKVSQLATLKQEVRILEQAVRSTELRLMR
jgi:AcrR family transcriptional regulator